MKKLSILIVLGLGILMSYQNCGKAPEARSVANDQVQTYDLINAGKSTATSTSALATTASDFHPERNPFLYGASNNNLVWTAVQPTPQGLYYLVQYKKVGVQNWVMEGTLNSWFTLPQNLAVGSYEARLTTCRDDLCLDYSEALSAQFQIVRENSSPTPSFDFNFIAHFSNARGRQINRVATQSSPEISVFYNSQAPIAFTIQVIGGDGVVECVFKDPASGASLGSCLANQEYVFPARHFTNRWFFEVTIRDNGITKKRKITFAPF